MTVDLRPITAEQAARMSQEYLKKSTPGIDSLIQKVNIAIRDNASRGITFVRVMDELDMKKPSASQWAALESHYRGLGYDWIDRDRELGQVDLGLATDALITWH